MDAKLLKSIVFSCQDALKDLEKSEEWKAIQENDIFPPTETAVIDAFATSLTNLLCRKVSTKMYQRYAIQTHIKKHLRGWVRMPDVYGLQHLDGSATLEFATYLLKKYLTQECIQEERLDTLEHLAHLILSFKSEDITLTDQLNAIVKQIAKFSTDETYDAFLENIISNPKIHKRSIENIYIVRKTHFIEKPLVGNFVKFYSNSTEFEFNHSISLLIEKCASFPSVFRLACTLLKNVFIETNYSEKVIDFTRLFLNRVAQCCELQSTESAPKSLMDLYPENLQSFMVLMRIEPSLHSEKSKENTLKNAKEIFCNCAGDLLILVSHFPEWLQPISECLTDIMQSTSFSMD